MSFSAVLSLGMGAMIGAGIFALLGEAGAIAGSAVWISFLIGGLIALLTGYSLGKLGARYPSAGGMVEYLIHGWGSSLFSGGMAVLMYLAGLLSLALVAKTFGNYGATLVPGSPGWLAPLLAVGVMVLFVAVNLRGSASVGRVELWIVLFKFAVLLTLAIGGLTVLKPSLLAHPPIRARPRSRRASPSPSSPTQGSELSPTRRRTSSTRNAPSPGRSRRPSCS